MRFVFTKYERCGLILWLMEKLITDQFFLLYTYGNDKVICTHALNLLDEVSWIGRTAQLWNLLTQNSHACTDFLIIPKNCVVLRFHRTVIWQSITFPWDKCSKMYILWYRRRRLRCLRRVFESTERADEPTGRLPFTEWSFNQGTRIKGLFICYSEIRCLLYDISFSCLKLV